MRLCMKKAIGLDAFLKTTGYLDLNQRRRIVEQAIVLFKNNYTQLSFVISLYGVDPIQKLRLLHNQLPQMTSGTLESEFISQEAICENQSNQYTT